MSADQEHIRENAVLLGDLVKFFRQKKFALFRISIMIGICCALLSLLMPIKYSVAASFKDGENSAGLPTGSSALTALLQGPKAKNSFAALMKSRSLLKEVIERSGIQISEEAMPFFFRVMKRIRRNISSNYNEKIAWAETIGFKDVHYSGKMGSFLIRGLDETHFVVKQANGQEISGEVNTPITFDEMTFTVTSIPKNKIGHWKRHYLQSMDELIDGLQKSVSILPNKLDDSIVDIKMLDGLPLRSIAIVNALMKTYKEHLVRESSRVTNEHLESLYDHKDAVQSRIADDFEQYANAMKQSVDAVGFLDYKTELSYLYEKEKRLVESIYNMDKHLLSLSKGLPIVGEEFEYRNRLLREEEQLRVTQSFVQFDLFGTNTEKLTRSFYQQSQKDPILANYLRSSIHEKYPGMGSGHIERMLKRIFTVQSIQNKDEKKNSTYKQYVVLDEKMLKEQLVLLYKQSQEAQLQTTSTEMAIRKLSENLYDIQSLKVFASELDFPGVFNIDDLLARKEDVDHFTEKERKQIESRVSLAKDVLSKKLEEQLAFLQQKRSVIDGTIKSVLEALALQCEKRFASVRTYRDELENEMKAQLFEQKKQALTQLQHVKMRLKKIPEKWAMNTKLEMSAEVDKNIMTHLLQFIESKNMQKKLSTIEARPLDSAYCSPDPIKASMMVFAIAGTGLGSFVGLGVFLFLGLIKGLPISGANVRFKGYGFLGVLSKELSQDVYSLNEVDLEVMRGVAAAASHQITSLAQGHGPYYAHLVASLLGYQGKKVLLLDFEQKIERGKALDGLYEFTIGEVSELPIQHKEQYDELTFGKKSLVKNEFLRSKQFEKGLRLLQQRYDCILLVTGTPLRSDEVASCMEYSSTAIVSFRSESWEEVRNVRNLAKARDMKLFFIEY